MFAFDELLNTALAAVTNGPEYVAFRSSWSLSGLPAILIVLNQSFISASVSSCVASGIAFTANVVARKMDASEAHCRPVHRQTLKFNAKIV